MADDPSSSFSNTPKPAENLSPPPTAPAPPANGIQERPPAPPRRTAANVKEVWDSLFAPEPAKVPDTFREILETVVFVVVLVLLLKTFAAEAFVIPTGSMATTLLGYNKKCVCPKCGHVGPVNCSQEADPQAGPAAPVVAGTCENCDYHFTTTQAGSPSCSTGDRVLVAKFFYDGPFASASDIGRQIIGVLAILIGGLLGARAAGKGVAWLLFRRRTAGDEPRLARVLLVVRIAAALGCAAVIGYCVFDAGPAWAMSRPERDDVVVFKYPKGPQVGWTPMNYIKRLIGQPGETIAIREGKLFVLPPDKSPKFSEAEERRIAVLYHMEKDGLTEADAESLVEHLSDRELALEMWTPGHMHMDDARDVHLFEQGEFSIVRKRPDVILAVMRLVYDNDHQASDLKDKEPQRWQPEGKAWQADGATAFAGSAKSATTTDWLHYQNLIPSDDRKSAHKQLITDFMEYNSQVLLHPPVHEGGLPVEEPARASPYSGNWVSDLILECDATIDSPDGELTLELCKGADRFRARWELASGQCSLYRVSGGNEEKIGEAATTFKGKGTHRRLRFANVDDRLTLWVDSTLPFAGSGVDYKAKSRIKPTDNDFQPASIGLGGADAKVRVGSLKLFRDTYYTQDPRKPIDLERQNLLGENDLGSWEGLDLPVRTFYVQPQHYFCLGDNSTASSDSRDWGLVPERLMLGRALLVYWPLPRAGRIR